MELNHHILEYSHVSCVYHDYALPQSKNHKVGVNEFKKGRLVTDTLENVTSRSFQSSWFDLFLFLKSKKESVHHFHNVHFGVLLFVFKYFFLLSSRNKVITIHTSYENYTLLHKFMFFISLLAFDNVVFCSEASKNSVPKFIKKILLGRAHVINNAVNIEALEEQSSNRLGSLEAREIKFVSVGRLVDVKQHYLILSLLSKIEKLPWTYTIVGSGPNQEKLESLCVHLGISDSVFFTGELKREEVYFELSRSDVFLSASLIEGLPIAPIEAIALGCFCFLSNIQQHQVFIDCELVKLLDYNSEEAGTIFLHILSIIRKRKNFSDGLSYVKKYFSSQRLVAEYDEIYRRGMRLDNC